MSKRRLITFWRIINTGLINFIRNLSLAVAAMAIMVITLTIVLFSLIVNFTFRHTISQITDKINVSVYLNNNLSTTQTNQLVGELKHLPNVGSVAYLSKSQVLKAYEQQNANNPQLIQAVNETNNPLPPTIIIKPINLNNLGAIKSFLDEPKVAALQSDPPSYSGQEKQAIDQITHATNVLQEIGVIAVIVFAVVSVLIIFNTIQMAIFNRRDEIQIMRLLGAGTGYIRGPFIVESIVYGIFAAVISVVIINASFQASSGTLQASSLGLLDIGYANSFFDSRFFELLLLQLGLGIVIGAISSLIATRRYLKFKTR
ncbi:permease-like cell division protein FtsX [Patescibacteria group bacterium]|nr:permease-like cell division protein FtsX [Patescibacteria group bacterium]